MGNAKSKLKAKSKRRSSRKGPSDFPESSTAQKSVDPRLPFVSYRQVFNLKNSWQTVSRALEDTAKTNLVLFFQKHPNHRRLFENLKALDSEEKMLADVSFENQAVAIFLVFDETVEHIETLDKAMPGIRVAAQAHSGIPGFTSSFFADMESTFLEAVSQPLGERWTEATQENFRLLYRFVTGCMTEAMASATNGDVAKT